MRYIIPLFCALTVAAQAQYGTFTDPRSNSNTSQLGALATGKHSALTIPEQDDPPAVEQLSHSGLSASARNAVTTSGVVSPVWAGSMSQISFAQSGMASMQLGTGYLAMTQHPASNLEGSSIFASVIPVFFGVRRNIAVTTTSNMEWTQYAVAGAGPLIGIEHPETASFWQSFSRMSFRWGVGGYAGLGSEMRFDHGLGLYAQLELTGFGFTAPLIDTKTFFGPSISFGFMFFPQ